MVDKKGRIELPEDIRELIGGEPGGFILLRTLEDGTISLKPRGRRLRDLAGMVDGNGIHLTVEQINDVINAKGLES